MIKNLLAFFFLSIFSTISSQETEKNSFANSNSILMKIIPNNPVEDWTVLFNKYAKDVIIKSNSSNKFTPSFEGFQLSTNEEGYYYISYTQNGENFLVTTLSDLKKFIGSIDNGEEAAILAICEGYIIDFDYKDYAANYRKNEHFYIVDAGKVTSEKCPLEKTNFEIWIDSKKGSITDIKKNDVYFQLFDKDCENNPHYDDLKKQMDQAKVKAEEQKMIQKKMTEKMQKRLNKLRRRD